MRKLPATRRLLAGAFILVLVIALAYWIRQRPKPEPEPSVKALFEDRRSQSVENFQSPIGVAIQKKSWPEVSKLAEETGGAVALARGVRSLFVLMEDGKYSPSDLQQLLDILVTTTQKQIAPGTPIPPEVANQILRLPTPSHRSAAERILLGWLSLKNAPGEQRAFLAMRKLLSQRLNPSPDVIQRLSSALIQSSGMQGNDTPFLVLDEIRNPKVKAQLVCELAKGFRRISKERQPQALRALVHNLSYCPRALPLVKLMTLQQLKSTETFSIEAGLRSVLPIHRSQALKPTEIEGIVKVLTSIPEAHRTPFVKAKVEEILKILQP
jgi:hypothetical protein